MRISAHAVDTADTSAALDEIFAALGPQTPDFAVIHASPVHDPAALRAAATARWGVLAGLHGGSSCLGVMSAGGARIGEGAGLGVLAIHDPLGDYGVAAAALGDDPEGAAAAATLAALADANRSGEAPELIWLTAAPGCEEAVIRGVERIVGRDAPIVGGSAADNEVAGNWWVFDRAAWHEHGVVVSVLFPSGDQASAFQSGYAPAGPSGEVTSAEGRILKEIDGRPAREVYAEWTGGAACAPTGPDQPILADSTLTPLGRRATEVADVPFYLLAHPAAARADGALELFADIELGEALHQMSGGADQLSARAGRVAEVAAARLPAPAAGGLMIFCGGCMLAMKERMDEVADRVDEALGGAPFLGVFTFGEQGPVLNGANRHGNLMISCVAFAS